jgi:hypothetical protein
MSALTDTTYINFMLDNFGQSEVFWLSMNALDDYHSRRQIIFSAQKRQSVISKLETRTGMVDIEVKLLKTFDLYLPVTAIDKSKNHFVMVVTTDTWSTLLSELIVIINDFAKITNDRAASVTLVLEILEFHRKRFSLLIESQKPFYIKPDMPPKCSKDFFRCFKKFLKKLKPLARNSSGETIVTNFKSHPFEFKLKQPIQLMDPNVLSSFYSIQDDETNDFSSKVGCCLKPVEQVVTFLKELLGPQGQEGQLHPGGEGGFTKNMDVDGMSNLYEDDLERVTSEHIVVQCVKWMVRITDTRIVVYLRNCGTFHKNRSDYAYIVYEADYSISERYTAESNQKEGIDKNVKELQEKEFQHKSNFKIISAHLILIHISRIDCSSFSEIQKSIDGVLKVIEKLHEKNPHALENSKMKAEQDLIKAFADKFEKIQSKTPIKESMENVFKDIKKVLDPIRDKLPAIFSYCRNYLLHYGPSDALENLIVQSVRMFSYAPRCWHLVACQGSHSNTSVHEEIKNKGYPLDMMLRSADEESPWFECPRTCTEGIPMSIESDDILSTTDGDEHYEKDDFITDIKKEILLLKSEMAIFLKSYAARQGSTKHTSFLKTFCQMYGTELVNFLLGLTVIKPDEHKRAILRLVERIDRFIFGEESTLWKTLVILAKTASKEFKLFLEIVWKDYEDVLDEVDPDFDSIRTVLRLLSISKFNLLNLESLVETKYIGPEGKPGYIYGLQINDTILGWLNKLCGRKDSFKMNQKTTVDRSLHSGMCLMTNIDSNLKYWNKSYTKFKVANKEFLRLVYSRDSIKSMAKETKLAIHRIHLRLKYLYSQREALSQYAEAKQKLDKEIENLEMECEIRVLLDIFLVDPKRFTFYLNLFHGSFSNCYLDPDEDPKYIIIKSINHKVVAGQKSRGLTENLNDFAFELIPRDLAILMLVHLKLRQSRLQSNDNIEKTDDTLFFSYLHANESRGRYLFEKLLRSRCQSVETYFGQINAYRRAFLNALNMTRLLKTETEANLGSENCQKVQLKHYVEIVTYHANKYKIERLQIFDTFLYDLSEETLVCKSNAFKFFKEQHEVLKKTKSSLSLDNFALRVAPLVEIEVRGILSVENIN